MNGIGFTERLARASAGRPWLVVAIWFCMVLVGGFFATGITDVLTGAFSPTNEPESFRADRLLEERLRGPDVAEEFIIVRSDDMMVDDPVFEAFVVELSAELRGLEDTVAFTTNYYELGIEDLVSDDRMKTVLVVELVGEANDAQDNVGPLLEVVAEANGGEGFEVLTAGFGSIQETFNKLSEEGLLRGEAIALPIALIILVIVFGAVVAAGLPIIIALASIVISVGITALIGRAFELNFLVVNMITMIGLAVGIDYTLFIVHRFREERRAGLVKLEAIARAGATASRAVLFSGGAVVVGLMGLLIVPSNVYRSLSLGAIIVATVAVIAALTLLPAVLSLLGDRVNALTVPFLRRGGNQEEGSGFWARTASIVMAHPVIALVITVSLLLAAAIPFLTINVGLAGVSTLPADSDSRRAFEILDEEFSGGLLAPAEIVIDAPDVGAPEVRGGIDRLQLALVDDSWFGETTLEANEAGDLALLSVLLNGDPDSDAAHDAIIRLRNDYIPAAFEGVDADVLVTGATASTQDMFDTIAQYTPYVFAFVLGLSFILLLLVFRSIVVPIKALIMNLLSVGAAYGLVVLVFQHGVGNELFGFPQAETIEAWLPLFLFAFLFGLSMDYHVFLLSRIREHWELTGDNTRSVAYGISTTAGLITGAALIMVAVFSGFAMGDVAPLQQSGFGLAVAIFLDATIIRTIVVPASMKLLGDWNWYLPSWLEWLPRLAPEGPPALPAPDPAGGSGGD